MYLVNFVSCILYDRSVYDVSVSDISGYDMSMYHISGYDISMYHISESDERVYDITVYNRGQRRGRCVCDE